MSDSPDVSVADAPERGRFEITVDGELAGICEYSLDSDVIALTHTEVLEGFDGRGLGGTLVRWALDAARERGLRVRPVCPYVAAYIEKHPEYADLVA